MRTSEQIKAEIEERFGFVPPFFEPALQNPQVLENLWQQTLSAYVNNPLSTLFKEKLFAYLSRYCNVPYCIVCHSCALRPLEMTAQEVLKLLESPTPIALDIERHLGLLAAQPNFLTTLPDTNSILEESLFYCAVYIFLEGERAQQCQAELCRFLGTVNYHHLVAYLAHIKTCHIWVEANPEVLCEIDRRVQVHLGPLLQQEPCLADFFYNYREKVNRERQSRAVQLAKLAERKQAEQALKQAYDELEVRVEQRTAELRTTNEQLHTEIAERKKVEESLCESKERLSFVLRVAELGDWDLDLRTYTARRSLRHDQIFGYESLLPEWTYEIFLEHVLPDERAGVDAKFWAAQSSGETWNVECQICRADGLVRWIWLCGHIYRDVQGAAMHMLGLVADITERKQIEKQLIHNAFHDALTGLPNRAFFMESLRRAVDYSKRHTHYLFAVLFLDLDRFKVINDSLGHNLGDQFLITAARRLKNCLRPTDTVARLGGDEFAVLLLEINDVGDAVNVAERIQAQLILPISLGIQNVSTTVSIGIALNNANYDNPGDILRDADIAMYRAKSQGRSCYELFDADMHTLAVARLQLESDMRRAIDRQEFQVHYQPIISIETGRISGFEALARWQHPQRGLISPVEFIPVAEETGLIVSIGHWVLHTACQDLHSWQMRFSAKPPLTVSVNLSAKQFTQPNLIEQISQILQEANLDAHSLSLEITESLVMENSDMTTDTLLQLRELGIQLSIDDFGTGYSSLGRLHSLPISVLKIDRSFVSNIGIEQGSLEIVEAIVTLAHKLGMEVIAEGVENVVQFAELKNLKCSYGQGYFFSQPLDKAAVEILIASNQLW